jgi:hypothetical protein
VDAVAEFLLSKSTPLTSGQRTKMLGELHANPAMGHKKKGVPLRSMK